MKDIVDFIKGFDLHTIIIVGVAFWWLNSGLGSRIDEINTRLTQVEKDMAVIKTVLQMKNIMSADIAKCEKKGE